MKQKIFQFLSKCSFVVILIITLILFCNWFIIRQTETKIYSNLQKIPKNEVGLVLGTSKYLSNGQVNLFFKYRIEAAAKLYYEGKIKQFILSGNNDSEFYNEPLEMKLAMNKLGIPNEIMTLDYNGDRTYDSILRAKELFKNKQFTIISQRFHDVRALFLAKENGIDAVAYAAEDVPNGYANRTIFREYLARPKAFLDVYLIHPAFSKLNEEIPLKKLKKVLFESKSDSISIYLPDTSRVLVRP